MLQSVSGEVELKVSANEVWKALTKDLVDLLPKLVPELISSIKILEGDGGLGSVLLLTFESGVPGYTYQKEKIVEMDDEKRIMANEVVEGGYKEMGFSYFKTKFELKECGESSTTAECTVEYETVGEELAPSPEQTKQASFFILKTIERYLLSKQLLTQD